MQQLATHEPSSTPQKPSQNWMIIAAATCIALPFDMIPILGAALDLTALMLALKTARQSVPAKKEASSAS